MKRLLLLAALWASVAQAQQLHFTSAFGAAKIANVAGDRGWSALLSVSAVEPTGIGGAVSLDVVYTPMNILYAGPVWTGNMLLAGLTIGPLARLSHDRMALEVLASPGIYYIFYEADNPPGVFGLALPATKQLRFGFLATARGEVVFGRLALGVAYGYRMLALQTSELSEDDFLLGEWLEEGSLRGWSLAATFRWTFSR